MANQEDHFVFMILPGNGCEDILDSNWYSDLADQIRELFSDDISRRCTVICKDMPDPYVARESIWIPFVEKHIEPHREDDAKLILIGHSSGAECCMRYIEKHALHACVLVSACVTDMDDENERKSGYYNREWNWELMKKNCPIIVQFGSKDDHLVDFESEQKIVFEKLASIPYIFEDRNHFLSYTVEPTIVQAIQHDIIKKL